MVVFLRDEMKTDEELKKILESYTEWETITKSIQIDDLERILFDVGPDANTTIPVDITNVKMEEDSEWGETNVAVPPPPEEHHGFDDFAEPKEDDFDFDAPSEKQAEKEEK